jgi:hypothetical protein
MKNFWKWLTSRLSDRIQFYLLSFVIVGFVIILVYADSRSKVAVSLLWACSCLATGGLVGFLFGIPRVLQGTKPDPEVTGQRRELETKDTGGREGLRGYSQEINTNLEQISDWLSKIIVGLGLVELRSVPLHLGILAGNLASDLGSPTNQSYASALIVYFSILGFFYGYLVTRLYLAGEFGRADRAVLLGEARGAAVMIADEERKEAQLRVAVAMGIMAQIPSIPDLFVGDAIEALEEARKESRGDRRSAITLAWLYVNKRHDLEKGKKTLTEAIDSRDELDSEAGKTDVSDMLYNRACYHRRSSDSTTDAVVKAKYKDLMYKDLRQCFKLLATNVGEAVADPDFESVRNEPAFIELVQSVTGAAPAPQNSPPGKS